MSAQRYCPYCQQFKPDKGFKQVLHFKSGSKRGMCPPCQELRKRPREELAAMAEQDKNSRNEGKKK